MRIVADQNIPCVAQAFADLGEVTLKPGRDIGPRDLLDCRCLITRAVTRVDARLLADSPVEFVGTATIGTDHLDLGYLDEAKIAHSNAAGCNAESAAEYVVSGLFALAAQRHFDPWRLKAGIIGFGNVGSRLHARLAALGIDCLVCDPPLQHSGASAQSFVDLDTLLRECKFISLHMPLTRTGDHPTFHLFDAQRLGHLAEDCVLVNAARGDVIDNHALLKLLQQRDDLCVFLDTWENEPQPLRELLQRVDLATPHIAGYSVEGRLRGTQMVLDAASAHFGLTPGWNMSTQLPPIREIDCRAFGTGPEFWHTLFQRHCDIGRDHAALLAGLHLDDAEFATHFDGLRRVYPERLEYSRFRLRIDHATQPADILLRLGFQLEN